MASLLDSRLGVGALVAAGVAVGVAAVLYLQRPGTPPAAPQAQAAAKQSWDGPIGPGSMAGAPSTSIDGIAASAGDKPLTDADGRLLVNLDLRRLFDTYLLEAKGEQRQARARELRARLDSRLATQPAARAQAGRLVDDYLRYLDAEEQQLARERFAAPDPAGLTPAQTAALLAWQGRRAELRERTLGLDAARAWFGQEDSDCRTALADWQRMTAAPGADEADSNELRDRRLHGEMLEQRRNDRAQACAGQLADRLALRGGTS